MRDDDGSKVQSSYYNAPVRAVYCRPASGGFRGPTISSHIEPFPQRWGYLQRTAQSKFHDYTDN